MSESLFYYEAKLSEKLGLERNIIGYARSTGILKKESGHWAMHGRDVVLSEDGVLTLMQHLELQDLPELSDCLVVSGPEKKEGLEELAVVRLYPNRNLLQAKNAAGELVNVRVAENKNFRPGMKLKAQPPKPDGLAMYRLEGRCPRYPGRY